MKKNRIGLTPVALATCALFVSGGAALVNADPERTSDGKSLVVPADIASTGVVYYVTAGKPGADADQTRFTNIPPDVKARKSIAEFTGFSNAVIGYVVVSSGDPSKLLAGEFVLPVDSLDTGNKLRNEHLEGKQWLNFKEHPEIRFSLGGLRNLTTDKSEGDFTSYKAEIFGRMTINGVTNDFSFPASLTVMPESERTRAVAAGDLIAIRASYSVRLSDFGIKNGIIGSKVADEISLQQFLILSTEKPSP